MCGRRSAHEVSEGYVKGPGDGIQTVRAGADTAGLDRADSAGGKPGSVRELLLGETPPNAGLTDAVGE